MTEKNSLAARAQGLAKALNAMSTEERMQYPTEAYAKNVNSLRADAIKFLHSSPAQFPPEIPTENGMSIMNYSEIMSYVSQISELLIRA